MDKSPIPVGKFADIAPVAGAPQRVDGFMTASDAPGLGVSPRLEVLGKPAGVIQ